MILHNVDEINIILYYRKFSKIQTETVNIHNDFEYFNI